MKKALYTGHVLHHRHSPKKHRFTYSVCYFFFNIAEVSKVITLPPFLSLNKKNYLDFDTVIQNIKNKFGTESAARVKKVFALTQLSYFGYCFNPVSFYYCYDENSNLTYVLSHVTNTPWNEKHIYLFEFNSDESFIYFSKDFHVSPFIPMNIDYTWQFTNPSEKLRVFMSNQETNSTSPLFFADLKLTRKEMTKANVYLSILQFPLMTFKTIFSIYWQALFLFLKKVPFYPHP